MDCRARSAAIGNARIKKMKARDELLEVQRVAVPTQNPPGRNISFCALQTLKKDTLEELAAFCKSPAYPEFVKKLIVQGLIKIEEDTVEIHARTEDQAIVKKVVSHCTSLL
jgi:hypothetical protein